MPSGSTSAGVTAGPTTTPAPPSRRRLVRILASTAVLVLACGAVALDLSRSDPKDPTSPTQAATVFADDNLNGTNGSPAARPSASRSPSKKVTAKAAAPAGFTSSSAHIPGTGKVYLGAAGDSPALARATGLVLSDHSYAFFSGKVPTGRMITAKAANTNWRSVAAAGPGSATYNDIVRWAQTIKARGGVIMFAYHHEPEGANSASFGTSADFIQAWRRVVTIFRAQGVRNVIYTWQMTAWAFRTPASDRRSAARWYPGDAYVDSVGADAYNWGACGEGSGNWEELKTLGDPVLAFARAHGKPASFPEFASHSDLRRSLWTSNALKYIATNRSSITGAFYFHRPPTVAANNDCKWPLVTAVEYLAFAALGRNRAYFVP